MGRTELKRASLEEDQGSVYRRRNIHWQQEGKRLWGERKRGEEEEEEKLRRRTDECNVFRRRTEDSRSKILLRNLIRRPDECQDVIATVL